ncbi:hypothetical protein DEQ92_10305 [Haloferax sp. Atlit-6N]|uniref:class I SAM-dependent methyltransferase n=1 Tax=unclassified Haloferax TaxID=2625095 RepID=UPI000E224A6A|nr:MULTISPECIES: methyltransferase domain-containing protein [unclassified Haloferax]REA03481.1 hypothetical protein DEQ92_10130 [Haloferax sp. Atlit-6N]REA03509.1 hypothetical protein DEQ92_10305 [Haloferax sp. Atlit-6N]
MSLTERSAEYLHLGSGPDYRDGWTNVDVNEDADPDVVADLTKPWDFASDDVRVIEAHHVVEHLEDRTAFFVEAAKALRPNGILRITVPLGSNFDTDSDHVAPRWTWRTPEQFSRAHRRQWDPDIPLELVHREVDVWLGGPLSPASPLLRLAAQRWPDWASSRCYAGELTAVFRRCDK